MIPLVIANVLNRLKRCLKALPLLLTLNIKKLEELEAKTTSTITDHSTNSGQPDYGAALCFLSLIRFLPSPRF